MQQIFVERELTAQTQLTLSGEQYRHLIKVLRLQLHDNFWIVDKKQQTFQAQITMINSSNFQVQLQATTRPLAELPVAVTIICALSKKDKVDWITQKATELGAKQIIFFQSRYSIMKWPPKAVSKKLLRLNQIAVNAAQQAHRLMVPTVTYYSSLKQLLVQESADYQLVAYEEDAKHNENQNLTAVLQQLHSQQSLSCLFGPEGGLAVEEIQQLRQNGYNTCGLGPRILRAETAPLYFLSVVSYQTELDKDCKN
ncbi:RsmE family RNA methyltransferase [Bombilactobacillus bombi]|uniref:RsmE family RNA methyltransferase n=1 Tax=Bombilactobacillus bombi TaxID=1303590 RepID=UPI0015E61DCB|nr:RsmE family RNA methyltransferase [Bombilactobacillus bombi]MBA1434614.1 16S rRNA (uracil(1498)-N(3))-methyltransferase [Bombilactobacillus bombi]